jgi:hypothetical protein
MPKAKKYLDLKITSEKLEELHSRMDGEVGMAKYGRFKAWLHYSNLNSWQNQKWHWGYVDYAGKEWHCTCGLVVARDAVAEVDGLDALELDAAHRARGHRKLPDFGEVVVAFIYDYKWMEDRGVYYYDAFCQVCGDYVLERPGKDADMFVDIHNISCGGYAQ